MDNYISNNLEFIGKILQQLPGMVVCKDLVGQIIACNDSYKQFTGIQQINEEATDYMFFSDKVANEITAIDREAIRKKNTICYEISIENNKGLKNYLNCTSPFFSDGKVVATTSVYLDFTEQREQYLCEINTLKAVIKLLPGNVYWKGLDNRYLGCNDEQAKSMGLENSDEIIGKLAYSRLPTDTGDVQRAADKLIMTEGRNITTEELGLREDGSQGVFLTKKKPIYGRNGHVNGLLGTSFDITDRKNQEKELRIMKEDLELANKLKSDFMSNMEHDIRSPFSAIAVFCSWLRDDEKDPYKKQVLSDVVNAGEELLRLCNDMLDFSKLEKNQHAHLQMKFELSALIDKISRLERVVASVNKLEFHVEYDPSIPKVITGDYFRVYRILVNLLSNAFKFTHEGAVLLSVKCLRKNHKEALIRFIVKDTGIGMPIDKQHFIFEKFSKLSRSHHGIHKGLGVGLSIVKQFMHDLEGEIDFVSEENEGTMIACTILFQVPLTNDYIDKSFIHKLILD